MTWGAHVDVKGSFRVPLTSAIAMAMALAVSGPATAAPAPARAAIPTAAGNDFNGDGYPDLVVTALYEDVGPTVDEGAVHVLYGSALGVEADGVLAPDDQFWTGGIEGLQAPAEAGSQFGWSTAAGDFNGDGFADLAIAVPYLDVGTVKDAGAVEVVYGSAAGLQDTGVGGPDDQLWTQDSPGVEDQSDPGEAMGRAVATGDFNGDGFQDLAVNVRGENVGTATEAGAVMVVYGSSTGLQADGTGGPDDQFWTQGSNGLQDQPETKDWFGRGLATGDFNGDGYQDLAAGCFLEDLGTSKDAGAVEVLYGSSTGLQADGTGGPDDQFWTQGSGGVKDRPELGDYFGHTVAAGDFNHDGFADLAIASRLEDTFGSKDTGAVEVLYGSSTGLQADGTGGPDDQFMNQGSTSVKDDPRPGDQFGFSLAVADFNGDSFADLAVGIPFKNVRPMHPDAGEVAVLYGSAVGLQAVSPDDQMWNQDSADVQDQAGTNDQFGISEGTGDYNGDGWADLAVGIHNETVGAVTQAGAVSVLSGGPGGLQADLPDDQLWSQGVGGVQDVAEIDDEFGWWVT